MFDIVDEKAPNGVCLSDVQGRDPTYVVSHGGLLQNIQVQGNPLIFCHILGTILLLRPLICYFLYRHEILTRKCFSVHTEIWGEATDYRTEAELTSLNSIYV